MRNFKIYIILLFVFIVAGCSTESKYENITRDCQDAMLEDLNMIEYHSYDTGCNFFVVLYHYQGKQYFKLGNHCVDMICYPFDCDGNVLCGKEGLGSCSNFYTIADKIGVIGMRI